MDVVDLFCGVGGFSCGAREAGCEPVYGVDCCADALCLWRGNTGADGCVACLFEDEFKVPAGAHVHLSPPCTALSKASRKAEAAVDEGLSAVRAALDLVLARGDSWSLENVSTPATRALLDEYAAAHPDSIAYLVVDASNFGVPSSRVRLIAGPPRLVRELQRTPVTRTSVEQAFAARGMALPARYLRNTTRTKARVRCVRPVDGPSHTQTASHPLVWCDAHGETVRCATVDETRVLMGFPSDWLLPVRVRDAFRALGNAIPPPLAKAIMRAALTASDASVSS